MPGQRQPQELPPQRAPEVGLHAVLVDARHDAPAHDPGRLEHRDPDDQRDRQRQRPRRGVTRAEGREHGVLGRPAERPRGQHGRDAVEGAGQDRTGEDLRLGLDRVADDAEPPAHDGG